MATRANVKTEYTRISDAQLIAALRHCGPFRGRGGKEIEPWLYAVADPWDPRKADLTRWFVTGPAERQGYIKGPFPREQVDRVAAAAPISPVCFEGNIPVAYRLHPMSEKARSLEAQLRHLTLPTQRGYRNRIERELREMQR
jgi:hypothetical protein